MEFDFGFFSDKRAFQLGEKWIGRIGSQLLMLDFTEAQFIGRVFSNDSLEATAGPEAWDKFRPRQSNRLQDAITILGRRPGRDEETIGTADAVWFNTIIRCPIDRRIDSDT